MVRRAVRLRGRASMGLETSSRFISSAARRVKSSALSLPASVLLLTVAIVLPIITFTAAFAVSDRVTAGDIWLRKGYFLSAAIDVPPAANFGSLGLTITLSAFAGVAIVRYHVVAARIEQLARSDLKGLHHTSLACALSSTVGGHGVAAFQHHANGKIHNSFAAIFVLAALAHFWLESHLERRAGLSSLIARTTRLVLCAVSTGMCATFLSHVVLEESFSLDVGIGKLAAAKAEILTVLCFLVYIATYSRSFHETSITLSVDYAPARPVQPRNDADTPTLKQGRTAPGRSPPHEWPQQRPSSLVAPDLFASPTNRLRRCFSMGDAQSAAPS